MIKQLPRTVEELKKSGWRSRSVKQELRENLIEQIRDAKTIFSGILGYEETVIPQIQNAILARHDILLLGLRGQAKTRIARSLINLLDPYMPALEGSPLRDDPYHPVSKAGHLLLERYGDNAPLEWIPRERRYHEKLATPDVTIPDLIGDIDPIKAVSRKLDLSDEEALHFGLIPRSNRGVFAINELPDLQARIQVGLFNILEEQDIQIRSFPIRLSLDLFMVFTANPEDYTNRGNIITPLKDRIAAQILTHYPEALDTSMAITKQEAWAQREEVDVMIPDLMRELVERVADEARKSDYVDKNSGVSARLPISLFETLISSVEKRALFQQTQLKKKHGARKSSKKKPKEVGRVCDLFESVPAITGKIELVYQGEQEGMLKVAYFLLGRSIKEAFNTRFLKGYKPGRDRKYDFSQFHEILDCFESGYQLEISNIMPEDEYMDRLRGIQGLEIVTRQLLPDLPKEALGFGMEFIIEGLAQNYLLSKRIVGAKAHYRDSVSVMMGEVEED